MGLYNLTLDYLGWVTKTEAGWCGSVLLGSRQVVYSSSAQQLSLLIVLIILFYHTVQAACEHETGVDKA